MSMQEGNGSGKVGMVRVGGMLFIGMENGNFLEKPRMIQFVQMKDGSQGIAFNEMPGKADIIEINPALVDVSYYPTDDGFVNAYREAVTGLTLPKGMPNGNNVVGINGRKLN